MKLRLVKRCIAFAASLGLAVQAAAAPVAGTVNLTYGYHNDYVSANGFGVQTSFTDSGSTITSCEHTTNGSSWSGATLYSASGTYWCNASPTCSDAASLTVNMRATNELSETGEGSALSKTCDGAAPETGDDAPSAWQGSDVTVTLSPTDAGSGVNATRYCSDFNNTCTPSTIGTSVSVTGSTGSATQKYVRFNSQDNLFYTETVKSRLVRIDKQSPTTGDNAPSAWQNADVNVTLSPSDGSGSGVASTVHCVDTSNSCSPATSGTGVSVTCGAGSVCPTQYARFNSVDAVGNAESVVSKLIRIDKELPTASITGPGAWIAFSSWTLYASGGDASGSGLAGFKYCVDTADTCTPTTSSPSGAVPVSCGAGSTCQKYARVVSVDNAGNESAVASALVQLDTQAPSTTDDAPSAWQSGTVSVTLTPTDAGVGVGNTLYCIDTANTCTPSSSGTNPQVTCGSGVCQKYLRYRSDDQLNNVEAVHSRLVRIDEQDPTASDNGSSSWTGFEPTITATGNDGSGSGITQMGACADTSNTCSPTLSASSSSVVTQVTCTAGSVCEKYLRYQAADGVARTSAIGSRFVRIDRENPTVSDDVPSGWQVANVSVTLTGGDGSGSGVANTKYCVDTADTCTPTTTASTFTVTCGSGSLCLNYARFRAQDNVSNVGSTVSKYVQIDKQAPTTGDDAPTAWQANDVTATLTPSDGSGSGVASTSYCVDTVNSCTPSTSGTSVSVTGTAGADTQKYARFRSQDSVGNLQSTVSRLVRIDKKAPTGGSVSYPNGNTSTPVSVTLGNGSDSGSGLGTRTLERQEANLQGNNCQTFGSWTSVATDPSSPYSDAVAVGKCYKWRHVVNDAVGNQAIFTSGNTAKVKN